MLSFFNSASLHLSNDQGFALTRWGDGEYFLMNNQQSVTQDKWVCPGLQTRLGDAIKDVLMTQKSPNFYTAIPGRCCSLILSNWYNKHMAQQNPKFVTCANVLINGQYAEFLRFMDRIKEYKKEIVLIANFRATLERLPFLVSQFITVDDDCVAMYEKPEVIEQIEHEILKRNDAIFLMCCGPLANALIGSTWVVNKNNYYFDVGSALDEYLFGVKTRPYQHKGTHYNLLTCEEFQ